MSKAQVIGEVSAKNVRAHVERIVNEIPHRAAGSVNGRRRAESSRDAMRQSGAEAVIHELPAIVSFPEHAEFRVASPVEIAIPANTPGHSPEAMADGVSERRWGAG